MNDMSIYGTVDFDKFMNCARQLGIYCLLINRLPEPH